MFGSIKTQIFTKKASLAVLATAALTFAPSYAFAQDEEETAPTSTFSYAPIKYDPTVEPENVWVLDLSNGERISIRLMPEWAPSHVERIKTLTQRGFYDGIIFHRVIDGFMAQGGDPTGTGQGGSELPDLEEEFNPMPHVRGTLAMARATDENSANSQFFIVFYPRFSLDKRYTNFGRVIDNMAGVDAINRGEPPQNPTRILQASLASDNRPPPAPPAPAVEQTITADLLNAPID
ncbi:peptidylprolyl isomerase [Erythrobacter sp. YT30]|uniref:peptidylprolyl isomerase n=1 Tax=Erythrobacter sp. YT30 TaxID=1735012 RepID=UPI00076D6AA7|nr:peptidylprolyl isomerase [Erythrobacter sp. YT30]KWV92864.1 peptidylprolyl isomerase [Erythrobacter sp. YT30]